MRTTTCLMSVSTRYWTAASRIMLHDVLRGELLLDQFARCPSGPRSISTE